MMKCGKYLIMKVTPKQRKAFQIDPLVTHQKVGFTKLGNKWRITSKENITGQEYRAYYAGMMKKLKKVGDLTVG
jgi:hypothetical protein